MFTFDQLAIKSNQDIKEQPVFYTFITKRKLS